jgi:hypothetical protein
VKESEPTFTKEEVKKIFNAKLKDLEVKLAAEEDMEKLQMYEMFMKHARKECINRKINFHDVTNELLYIHH